MMLDHLNRLCGFLFILIGITGILILSSKKSFENKSIIFISLILLIAGFVLLVI